MEGSPKKGDIYRADSLYCTVENNTTLWSDYTIKINF